MDSSILSHQGTVVFFSADDLIEPGRELPFSTLRQGMSGLNGERKEDDLKRIEKKRRKTSATGKGDKDDGWGKFTLYAPEANHVFLAGEFNHWDTQSLPMKRDKDGVWKISVKLSPGRYDYKLFVDNTWVEDIPGAESTSNPFGTRNFATWVK